MARTVQDKPITTRASRAKLNPSPNAHFRRLTDKLHVGYRKGAKLPGLWTVRMLDADGVSKQKRIPGVADDLEPANGNDVLNFDQACEAARNIFAPAPTAITVARALDDWFADKLARGMKPRAEHSTMNYVLRTKRWFGDMLVLDLTVSDIERYRDSFLEGHAEDRLRARRATANRDMNTLRAALNFAADRNLPDAARPWGKVKNFAKADAFGKRVVVLTLAEEQRLYDACESGEVRNLWLAAFYTGARYGELVAANVRDLASRRLTVDGKTGRRTIVLSPKADAFFRSLVKGVNDPDRALLVDENGDRWHHDHSRGPIDRSIAKADLPEGTTFYCARHSYITRHLSRSVPVMAIAQNCGTSLEMIEATYANFVKQDLEVWFSD